jgi:hypothetical protein
MHAFLRLLPVMAEQFPVIGQRSELVEKGSQMIREIFMMKDCLFL